jgi:hypothetical protein
VSFGLTVLRPQDRLWSVFRVYWRSMEVLCSVTAEEGDAAKERLQHSLKG